MNTIVASALAALLLVPAAAPAATPRVCTRDAITAEPVERGKLKPGDADLGRVVSQVRCRDVTGDGRRDAVFAVSSGGTAGNTRWGVMLGRARGAVGRLATWRNGYKIAVAVNRGDPEVLQPVFAAEDPNCCPSSFRIGRYHYVDRRFRLRSTKRSATAPERFRS